MKSADTAKPLSLSVHFPQKTFTTPSPAEENKYLHEFLIGRKFSVSPEKLFEMCNIVSLST